MKNHKRGGQKRLKRHRKVQSENSFSKKSLLQFPDEILRLILFQVPDHHWNVSQSCSRMYHISCEVKLFNLKIQFQSFTNDDIPNVTVS